ncbi:hypothetical protein CBR_g40208 [Chara braunii]|uniref:LIMR family protein n=1 Tax=Chara braunii TaxID=69332 RepID=A0A388LTD3_CHABU|nr:hypothetical protein CBR_g40208 [Chara braunii]|eukprot:GBG85570.1 hypothetical protein CBR_g40208 [Chara braunii]
MAGGPDFNAFLIIMAVVVTVAVFLVNVYVLVNYQHPDDKNQAYLPKFVVVLGLSVAQISILMLPLDVANRKACENAIVTGACNLTLPMEQLWSAIYIINVVLVFFVIPFSMFFYEADMDDSPGKRAWSALQWCLVTAVVVILVLGIMYGVVGYVDLPVRRLDARVVPFSSAARARFDVLGPSTPCLLSDNTAAVSGPAASECYGYGGSAGSEDTWSLRSSFPVYVIALSTIVGSVLFAIFGGVGIISLPLDCIFSFFRRPKALITRSQYIQKATELGRRAREIRDTAQALQKEERAGSKGRKWKKNVRLLQHELVYLEQEEMDLAEVYPQGEEAEAMWALTVVGYLCQLLFGLVGLVFSALWIGHIIVYSLMKPPASVLLNDMFVKLDNAFGLFGTAAFALFCFYLLLAVVAGEMKLGLTFVLFTVHPMRWGRTLMSSFLFNVGLILLCSISVIQFCATAFALYAQETAVANIFGHQLENLRGIKVLFRYGIFQIVFVSLAFLTFVYYIGFGWRRRPRTRISLTG